MEVCNCRFCNRKPKTQTSIYPSSEDSLEYFFVRIMQIIECENCGIKITKSAIYKFNTGEPNTADSPAVSSAINTWNNIMNKE